MCIGFSKPGTHKTSKQEIEMMINEEKIAILKN